MLWSIWSGFVELLHANKRDALWSQQDPTAVIQSESSDFFSLYKTFCSIYWGGRGVFNIFESFCSSPLTTSSLSHSTQPEDLLTLALNVKVQWGRRLGTSNSHERQEKTQQYGSSASHRSMFFAWGRRVFSYKATVFWDWLLESQVLINSPSESCAAMTAFCAFSHQSSCDKYHV